jgi:hypothetical protein
MKMEATIYNGNIPIAINVPDSKLTKNQKKSVERIIGNKKYILNLRYDDECGNGHNSFSITLDIYRFTSNKRWVEDSCGCQHETVEKIFPNAAHLIPFHLMSSIGPMHYISNSLYHASSRDHWGLLKGEVRSVETKIQFGTFPITFSVSKRLLNFIKEKNKISRGFHNLEIEAIHHKKEPETFGAKYTFSGETEWYKCPFNTWSEADSFLKALQNFAIDFIETPVAWGEGKEPDLKAARNSAVWPDAELSDFTEENLLDRLPGLIEKFKAEIEKLGFVY